MAFQGICSGCGKTKQVVLVSGWRPICLECLYSQDRMICARCGIPLHPAPAYKLKDRLYCSRCVEVMKTLLATTRPEPIGCYKDEEDLLAEVMGWRMILESLSDSYVF